MGSNKQTTTTTATKVESTSSSSLEKLAQPVTDHCQVCHKVCRPKRCQNCRMAFYCSVPCQRLDWKHHRKMCRRFRALSNGDSRGPLQRTNAAQAAWRELTQLLSSSTLPEAHEDQVKAMDHVALLLEEEKQRREQGKSSSHKPQSDHTAKESVLSPSHDVVNVVKTDVQRGRERESVQSTHMRPAHTRGDNLSYFVEDMIHLSCYQVLLRPINPEIRAENISIQLVTSPNNNNTTVLVVRCGIGENVQDDDSAITTTTLRLDLDKCIPQSIPPRVHLVDQGKAVSIRLTYSSSVPDNVVDNLWLDNGTATNDFSTCPLLQPHQANRLACRHCGQFMFSRKNDDEEDTSTKTVIDQILPLPSHNFDGLDDYLICYPGQAAMQFGALSTSAQAGKMFQDDTVLVVHASDVRENAICVLAIPGYGEVGLEDSSQHGDDENERDYTDARIRGHVPWREAVGGATLTCSCCASILGVAPIELLDTFRLFQHQLAVGDMTASTSSQLIAPAKQVSTIARFIAHEMVRYSESKAIFTFCVCLDNGGTATNCCLMMRLLSGETIAAFSSDSRVVPQQQEDFLKTHRLKWGRVSKVLFEEMTNVASHIKDKDELQWIWTINDWCCPRSVSMSETDIGTTAVSSTKDFSDVSSSATSQVRLYLSRQDWEELCLELKQSAGVYPREVTEATVSATMGGRLPDIHDGMSLAVVAM